MKVALCYTNLEAACRLALVSDGIEPILLETLGQFGYYKALAGLWEQREGFVMIEGDIVVWPGAVQAMIDHPADWVARSYWINGELRPAFGCVKFSSALIERHPMLFLELPELRKEWWAMDMGVYETLKAAGEELVVLDPPVTHLHNLHCPGRERYGI
jgi:hypothetical protein